MVMQNKRPLEFLSRKCNIAQSKHTTTDQELLGIVERINQYRTMLLGQRVTVHTDHMNLIHM